MKPNKLFNLLQSLTIKEFKELEAYVKSPFLIKRRTDLPAFYQALKPFYPFTKIEAVTKEFLFEEVYSEQDFNGKKFRSLLSDFVKIIENYLLFLENEVDRFEKDKRLVAIYGKRNVYDEFTKGKKKLITSLEAAPYRDANFYFNKYRLESDFYFHPKTQNRKEVNSLLEGIKDFESFFVLERAKLGLDLKNMEKLYNITHDFNLEDFSNTNPKNNLIYILFKKAFSLIDKQEKSIYLELYNLYKNEIKNLSKENQLVFFSILQNFASQQLRINEKEYLPLIIKLYTLALENEVLLNNGKIHVSIFINIIILNLKAEKYIWVEQTIEKYKDSIGGQEPKLTLKLANAFLRFQKENYFEVIKSLKQVKLQNIINHLRLRSLIIRTYFNIFLFDKNYFASLENESLSFEKYLSRNKEITSQRKIANLNFSKIIRKISKVLNEEKWNSDIKSTILSELNQTNLLAYKSWLIEQVTNL